MTFIQKPVLTFLYKGCSLWFWPVCAYWHLRVLLLLYLENQYPIGLCIHEQVWKQIYKINLISLWLKEIKFIRMRKCVHIQIPSIYCIWNLMRTVHILKNDYLQHWLHKLNFICQPVSHHAKLFRSSCKISQSIGEYKYLSWLFSTDRNFHLEGHCLASWSFAEWCQTAIPKDRNFCPYRTAMTDNFSCIPPFI